MRFQERVIACFKGLATGDAIGKQTETLAHRDVLRWYPHEITGFHGRPGEIIPRYVSKRYSWRVGETTDDTEQTIAVAKAILSDRCVRHQSIGKELLKCRKSVHPGVCFWAFVQTGDPARIASGGDGCGAAMRVAPVGVVCSSAALDRVVRAAYECAIPTHGGQSAVCAAAAVAAAVSAALDGHSATEVLAAALFASREAESLRPSTRQHTIAESIEAIHSDLAARASLSIGYVVDHYFPVTPETIVPLAISLALITESAEETALLAANIGGDADSVASIGSAIAGALCPESVNQSWFDVVSSVNGDDELLQIATQLAALRADPSAVAVISP